MLPSREIGIVIAVAVIVITAAAFVMRPTAYADPAQRFRFDVPRHDTVGDFPAADGSSETLIIDGGPDDAQIVITPWTGGESLADLKTQYPYLSIEAANLSQTSVAGIPALAFGNQIWLVHGSYLYVFEDVPPVTLSSWRF